MINFIRVGNHFHLSIMSIEVVKIETANKTKWKGKQKMLLIRKAHLDQEKLEKPLIKKRRKSSKRNIMFGHFTRLTKATDLT